MTEPTSSSEPNQPDAATRIAELEGQIALLKDTVRVLLEGTDIVGR